MKKATPLPLIAQANAGQPIVDKNGNILFSQSIDDYVRCIPQIIENGASVVGGCCGTGPEYIRKIAKILNL
jgi:5-methyltetrahydrofolate--homocysteine methyltransferase